MILWKVPTTNTPTQCKQIRVPNAVNLVGRQGILQFTERQKAESNSKEAENPDQSMARRKRLKSTNSKEAETQTHQQQGGRNPDTPMTMRKMLRSNNRKEQNPDPPIANEEFSQIYQQQGGINLDPSKSRQQKPRPISSKKEVPKPTNSKEAVILTHKQ